MSRLHLTGSTDVFTPLESTHALLSGTPVILSHLKFRLGWVCRLSRVTSGDS